MVRIQISSSGVWTDNDATIGRQELKRRKNTLEWQNIELLTYVEFEMIIRLAGPKRIQAWS